MNIARTIIPLALLAALATTAQAQSEKTRAQVKAEWAEAVRTGDVQAPGDTGLKLNELYPQRYPHAATTVGLTRAQVKAEFAEAVRTGNVVAAGEGDLRLNEEFPQRYPAALVVATGMTRAEVKAETLEAIRTGDMVANNESGLKLNEEFPQRYAKARASYAGRDVQSASLAASAASR